MKFCRACRQDKPESAFYRNDKRDRCKECLKAGKLIKKENKLVAPEKRERAIFRRTPEA
jgi:hypothetical protein